MKYFLMYSEVFHELSTAPFFPERERVRKAKIKSRLYSYTYLHYNSMFGILANPSASSSSVGV